MAGDVSREVIARQAQAVAASRKPGDPPAPNPYCAHFEPDHHKVWNALVKRYEHERELDPEAEGSA